ncbi:MAG: response regulator [Ignavibacteria bacterium]|nr:response regulator [Ignavibacteria bacterium]
MIALIVILTIIVFIIVDVALRFAFKKREQLKIKRERERALDIGLKLDFTVEAASLKRVQVDHQKARILAIDDEPIILDSFRKILVLAGYSIDTVENGKEALGLIQKEEYDFVFTDLKMPEMDGIEVTKAVKHLRPDIDVIVITGYATIESAVETMKYGAADYVQKPFAEDELIEFVKNSLIRRHDRIERQMKPTIRLVTQTTKESTSKREFNVPAGAFLSNNHTWIQIELNGNVRVGVDDFIKKIIDKVDEVVFPDVNHFYNQGNLLFSLKAFGTTFEFKSPITGKIVSINEEYLEHPEWIRFRQFELCWICIIEPSNLSEEIVNLKIGKNTIDWYQSEINRYTQILISAENNLKDENKKKEKIWNDFKNSFL